MVKDCDICGKSFNLNNTRRHHMKRAHGEGYPCKYCDTMLSSRLAQRAHMADACDMKPELLSVEEVERLIKSKCREYTDALESEIAKYTQLLEREKRRSNELERQIADSKQQPVVPARPANQNALAMPDWINH